MGKRMMGVSGGIFVLIISIVFFIYSAEFPFTSELGPGPGFFPRWISGLLIPLSLIYLYSTYRGKDTAAEAPSKAAQKDMAFILVSMGAFVALLPYVGFNITSSLFLFVLLRKGYNWYNSLGIAVAASIILFLLFTEGFATPLPVNAWGF